VGLNKKIRRMSLLTGDKKQFMTIEKFTPQVVSPSKNGNHWHALGTSDVLVELKTLS
jgi:hypothetical protein